MDSEKFHETDAQDGKLEEQITDLDEFSEENQKIEAEIEVTEEAKNSEEELKIEVETGEADVKTSDCDDISVVEDEAGAAKTNRNLSVEQSDKLFDYGKFEEQITDLDEFSEENQKIEAEIEGTEGTKDSEKDKIVEVENEKITRDWGDISETQTEETKTESKAAKRGEMKELYKEDLDSRMYKRQIISDYLNRKHDSEDDAKVKSILAKIKSLNQQKSDKSDVWLKLELAVCVDYTDISSSTFNEVLQVILDAQPEESGVLSALSSLLQSSEYLELELSKSRMQLLIPFLTKKGSWTDDEIKADAFDCLGLLISSGFGLLGDDKVIFIKLFFDECDKTSIFEDMRIWISDIVNEYKSFDDEILKGYRTDGFLSLYAAVLSNIDEKNHIFEDMLTSLLSGEQEVKESIRLEWYDIRSSIIGRRSHRRITVSLLQFFESILLGSLTYENLHRATAILLSEWYSFIVLEEEYGELKTSTNLLTFLRKNYKRKGNKSKGTHILLDELKKKYVADQVTNFKEILFEFNCL